MPKYWMITDRKFNAGQPTGEIGDLTFWTSDKDQIDQIGNWSSQTQDQFRNALVSVADQFPNLPPGDNANQKHVCFFIHGYNNGFVDAAQRYQKICSSLFNNADGLGVCISLDWPSFGNILGYVPDREHANKCSSDIALIFDALHQWLLQKQRQTMQNPNNACKAKISVIAHSMGNYATQKALATVWKRNNQPLSLSLINQYIMVAADVDNDLFDARSEDTGDGEAVANLTYRITSLFSGRDDVLGASAGLKHFGTRRLGRSGLANRPPIEMDGAKRDNVWDIDCSSFFPKDVNGLAIHGAYFETPEVMALMKEILKGTDRSVLDSLGLAKGTVWP
jgi:esterase/lipase superfamily enzyme